MNNLSTYIIEKLKIDKDMKEQSFFMEKLIKILNPKYYDVIEYLYKWVKEENIIDIDSIYLWDYRNNYKTIKNLKDIGIEFKIYNDINDGKTDINREVYTQCKGNWYFIGKDEGLGYWKEFFAYTSSNKKLFIGTIYIVGIKEK